MSGKEKVMVIHNSEAIENVNQAMVMALESKNRLVGTTYVVEDGLITEIHESKVVIVKNKESE